MARSSILTRLSPIPWYIQVLCPESDEKGSSRKGMDQRVYKSLCTTLPASLIQGDFIKHIPTSTSRAVSTASLPEQIKQHLKPIIQFAFFLLHCVNSSGPPYQDHFYCLQKLKTIHTLTFLEEGHHLSPIHSKPESGGERYEK